MKHLLFSLLFFHTHLIAQDSTHIINSHNFRFRTVKLENDAGPLIRRVYVYRNKTKLLTHTIFETSGDCDSETLELGTYEIKDSTITFYSYWAHAGDAPASPYGVRKQIYTISYNGKMKLTEKKSYTEIHDDPEPGSVPVSERDALIDEVKNRFQKTIDEQTRNWKKIYKGKIGGYKY
jgi:hypothetical protein